MQYLEVTQLISLYPLNAVRRRSIRRKAKLRGSPSFVIYSVNLKRDGLVDCSIVGEMSLRLCLLWGNVTFRPYSGLSIDQCVRFNLRLVRRLVALTSVFE